MALTSRAASGLTSMARDPRVLRAAFWSAIVVLYALLAANLYRGLGLHNIADWDEARQAISAYEMLGSGDIVANTYRGDLDYWNLKPSLSFWAVMASYQLFGFTPFALRFPSTVAMLGTAAVVTWFSHRLGGRAGALAATAAVVTCYPLIVMHSGRTGDPDALFVLFFTVSVVAGILARQRPELLLVSTLGFSAAFLTKSFHAGPIVLIVVAYLLVTRGDSAVRWRHVTLSLAGLLPVLAWAVARFAVDGTTFFVDMVRYDLLSRSSQTLEKHGGGLLLYLQLIQEHFGWWLAVLVGALAAWVAVPALTRGRWQTSSWLGPAIWVLLLLIPFTLVKTKIDWYTHPAYPALAILIGLAVARALSTRVTGVLVLISVVALAALVLSDDRIRDEINSRPATPVQTLLASLDRETYLEADIYLDDALDSSELVTPPEFANLGDWPPSLYASAILNLGAVPRDGGVDAFLAGAEPGSLLLVERGSDADREVAASSATIVATEGDFYLARG